MENILRKIGDVFSKVFVVIGASWISLLIILLVFLLTNMDQSDTIVIDLLDEKPLNFFLFIYLLLSLSFIVSHYPAYLEIRQNKPAGIKWRIHSVLWGWGFITYTDRRKATRTRFADHARNIWGIFLLWAVVFILVVVHGRNIDVLLSGKDSFRTTLYGQFWMFGMLSFGFYYFLQRFCLHKDRAFRRRLVYAAMVICITSILITGVYISVKGWSLATYRCFYGLLFILSFFYSILRTFRKDSFLGKDLDFLRYISVSGFVSLSVIVYGHFEVYSLNPFNLILAGFILFYGLFIIPIKHYYYYKTKSPQVIGNNLIYRFFVWFIPVSPLLLVAWAIMAGNVGNNLHLLETIPEDPAATVGFQQFVDDFDARFSEKDTVFFIASYGGGLKANIWNQMILDTLTNYNGRNILSHTVAISGVSGGSIGHAVFSGLYNKRVPTRKAYIQKLNGENLLSLDITYLMGKELFLELVPGWLWPSMGNVADRAKQSMRSLDEFVGGRPDMLKTTFRTFWANLYQKEKREGRFFPALIANAAATHAQRGIACSVNLPTAVFDTTFFDSVDLLSFEDSTSLPFLYAVSCTNRFPFFSPAAKVRGKGHFIDGGYFDNSGMLSLQDFYSSFVKASRLFRAGGTKPKVVFIQIINSKDEYIKSLLRDHEVKKVEKESLESGSVLRAVFSISFVPSYLMKKYEHDPNYVQIHLPYFVTPDDINNLFEAKSVVLDPDCQSKVNQSNDLIRRLIGADYYRYVQPPLARLLGPQSFRYMEISQRELPIWKDLNRVVGQARNPSTELRDEITIE